MALCYLDGNPRYPQTMRKWRRKNNVGTNEAKVRSLMSAKFILYTDAPPEVFVEAVDDNQDVFVPDDKEKE